MTACPTGIAHTYMAAEALEEEARKRGHEIHVETQGSGGADTLDASEIADAVAVVIAADMTVSGRERFAGLPSVETTPGEAINRAGAVLDRAEAAAREGVVAEPAGPTDGGDVTAPAATGGPA